MTITKKRPKPFLYFAALFFILLTGVELFAPILSNAQRTDGPKNGNIPMKTYDEYLKEKYTPGMPKVEKTDEEWKKILTPEQYRITRSAGTERPFCGLFHDNHKEGIYICICCGLPLFESGTKFDSGTGWPSFFRPISPDHVAEKLDTSWGMRRIEVNCARCDAHLGHVFDDGPRPTGLRYCMNSESLDFVEKTKPAQ